MEESGKRQEEKEKGTRKDERGRGRLFIFVNSCAHICSCVGGESTFGWWSGWSGGKAGSKQRRFLLPKVFSKFICGVHIVIHVNPCTRGVGHCPSAPLPACLSPPSISLLLLPSYPLHQSGGGTSWCNAAGVSQDALGSTQIQGEPGGSLWPGGRVPYPG